MSALHSIDGDQGAGAVEVFALLGVESLVRRLEAAAGGEIDDTGGSLDAPGLVLLGLMSLHRRWCAMREAAREAVREEPRSKVRPPPRPLADSLLR